MSFLPWFLATIGGIALSIIGREVYGYLPNAADALARLAARIGPKHDRDRWREEFQRHVADIAAESHNATAAGWALGCVLAAAIRRVQSGGVRIERPATGLLVFSFLASPFVVGFGGLAFFDLRLFRIDHLLLWSGVSTFGFAKAPSWILAGYARLRQVGGRRSR